MTASDATRPLKEVRWGMIGCGSVTETKSAPALSKVAHSRLIAVMSRTADRVRDYAERHAVPNWTTKASEVIEDPEVNAVYISTPPDSHLAYTRLAARAGKPVYVEKPMGRTHEECQHMLDACQSAAVPLFVAYYRRALPNFLKVKDLIENGAIGTVDTVHIALHSSADEKMCDPDSLPWRVQTEVSGGGLFMDLASHQFDFLDFILGPIAEANGAVANRAGLYPAEDMVCANFTFESGALGSGNWCFCADNTNAKDIVEITGDRGRITFSSFAIDPVRLESAAQSESFPTMWPEHVQQPLIETVVASLRGTGSCPSTGESGARANAVIDAIYRDNPYLNSNGTDLNDDSVNRTNDSRRGSSLKN